MLKKRIIPILLIKNGVIVKTVNFINPRIVGDIKSTVQVFANRLADELCIIDIDAAKNRTIDFDLVEKIAKIANMPLSYGGYVNDLDTAKNLYNVGIDKLIVRSCIFENENEIEKISGWFGYQSIIANIDYIGSGKNAICIYGPYNKSKGGKILSVIERINNMNIGEILLNSVDRDGMMTGYDIETLKMVKSKTKYPVIISSGCGTLQDALDGFTFEADAIAAGSLFYWVGESIITLKSFLYEKNIPIRMK
tara:strand:+ start:82 stop:834 length:753 start_codon:yes stop_codon:yes gene_type:complete